MRNISPSFIGVQLSLRYIYFEPASTHPMVNRDVERANTPEFSCSVIFTTSISDERLSFSEKEFIIYLLKILQHLLMICAVAIFVLQIYLNKLYQGRISSNRAEKRP